MRKHIDLWSYVKVKDDNFGAFTGTDETKFFDIPFVPRDPLLFTRSRSKDYRINIITETETETIQSQSHNNQRRRIHKVLIYTWSTQGRDLEYHQSPLHSAPLPLLQSLLQTYNRITPKVDIFHFCRHSNTHYRCMVKYVQAVLQSFIVLQTFCKCRDVLNYIIPSKFVSVKASYFLVRLCSNPTNVQYSKNVVQTWQNSNDSGCDARLFNDKEH